MRDEVTGHRDQVNIARIHSLDDCGQIATTHKGTRMKVAKLRQCEAIQRGRQALHLELFVTHQETPPRQEAQSVPVPSPQGATQLLDATENRQSEAAEATRAYAGAFGFVLGVDQDSVGSGQSGPVKSLPGAPWRYWRLDCRNISNLNKNADS
jgi:hypothetical protein